MRPIFRATSLIALTAALASCQMADLGADFGAGGFDSAASEEAASDAAYDMTDAILQQYRDGNQKARFYVPIHAGAQAGQYMESAAERLTIVRVDDGKPVIESTIPAMQGVVFAFQVDPSVPAGEPNVVEAWIGKEGEKPITIAVMEAAAAAEANGQPQGEVTEEPFSDLAIGDSTWSGKLVTVEMNGQVAKTWIAQDG